MSDTNESLQQRRVDAIPRGVGQIHTIFADRAENSTVWDVEGREFLDFAGGIAVLNTGHLHPKIVAAVQEQLTKVSHTCFHVFGYKPYVELCEKLNKLVPGNFPKKTLLVTTGAEADENAVKIARAATGRTGVIAFTGGYHGRTMMTLSLTGKVAPYSAGMGLMPGHVYRAQYPNALHGVSTDDAMDSIERIFKNDAAATDIAAIILEPVQGEGGFHVAPKDFMLRLRALCDQHGIKLIADEVQTGAGRTGTFFAMEQMGVAADLTTFAKSIAGGFPLAGVTGRAEIMDSIAPGGLGGTYAGNPISCAAALAVLEIFEEEKLLDRAKSVGEILVTGLKATPGDDSYRQLQAKGLPIIAIDRVMEPEHFCSVISDDREASLHLTQSLLDPLPKQIALIGARPELSISQERAAGFKEALTDYNGEVLIENGESCSRECGKQLMEELLQRVGHLPEALVTTSYVLLQGVFDALHDFPLKNRPLRLGTFGDTQLLDFLPLPVNAMAQQHQLIADKALALALAAIEQSDYQPGVQAIPRTFKQRIRQD